MALEPYVCVSNIYSNREYSAVFEIANFLAQPMTVRETKHINVLVIARVYHMSFG